MNTRLSLLVCSLTLLFGFGCSQPSSGPVEITEVRPATEEERTVEASDSTQERLGLRPTAQASSPMSGSAGGAAEHPFAWDAPAAWEVQASSAMRLANFKVSENSECYFTVLGGDGGGLAANINRWRGQMNLEPQTEAEIAALPKITLLHQDATFVSLDGEYSGMGGGQGTADYRMLGAALIFMERAFFVKMTGPIAEIEGETENFRAFCESIRLASQDEVHDPNDGQDHSGHDHGDHDGHDHGDHDGHDHSDEDAAMPEASASGLPPNHPEIPSGGGAVTSLPPNHPEIAPSADGAGLPAGHPEIAASGGFDPANMLWTAPEGWERAPERMMRAVTYTVDGAECYISVLPGAAGGVEANINRWIGQMGQNPLPPDQIGALPKINVFGDPAPLVEVEGDFTGMNGETQTNRKLLGTIATVEDQSVFVKMTGPSEAVSAQRDKFIQFCESLQRGA